MKRKFTAIVLMVFLTGITAGTLSAGEWKSRDVDGFHFEWKVDGLHLKIRLSAPTEGWISVGFNPTRIMKNANILIGYVADGKAVVYDHFGNGAVSHRSDKKLGGTRDVSNISGTESKGITKLRFTIPLNSRDSKDRVLIEGKRYKLIFALHKRDHITKIHTKKASTMIVL